MPVSLALAYSIPPTAAPAAPDGSNAPLPYGKSGWAYDRSRDRWVQITASHWRNAVARAHLSRPRWGIALSPEVPLDKLPDSITFVADPPEVSVVFVDAFASLTMGWFEFMSEAVQRGIISDADLLAFVRSTQTMPPAFATALTSIPGAAARAIAEVRLRIHEPVVSTSVFVNALAAQEGITQESVQAFFRTGL